MTTAATIYHNPRCSKSRQTLQVLQDNGITPKVVEYLNDAPDRATLTDILNKLGMRPFDLIRKKEAKDLGVYNTDTSDNDMIDIILENPILMERPIVVTNKGARIGRPPEGVTEIL